MPNSLLRQRIFAQQTLIRRLELHGDFPEAKKERQILAGLYVQAGRNPDGSPRTVKPKPQKTNSPTIQPSLPIKGPSLIQGDLHRLNSSQGRTLGGGSARPKLQSPPAEPNSNLFDTAMRALIDPSYQAVSERPFPKATPGSQTPEIINTISDATTFRPVRQALDDGIRLPKIARTPDQVRNWIGTMPFKYKELQKALDFDLRYVSLKDGGMMPTHEAVRQWEFATGEPAEARVTSSTPPDGSEPRSSDQVWMKDMTLEIGRGRRPSASRMFFGGLQDVVGGLLRGTMQAIGNQQTLSPAEEQIARRATAQAFGNSVKTAGMLTANPYLATSGVFFGSANNSEEALQDLVDGLTANVQIPGLDRFRVPKVLRELFEASPKNFQAALEKLEPRGSSFLSLEDQAERSTTQLVESARQFEQVHGRPDHPPSDLAGAEQAAAEVGAHLLAQGHTDPSQWAFRLKSLCGRWVTPLWRKIRSMSEGIWFQKFVKTTGEVVDARSGRSVNTEATTKRRASLRALLEDPAHANEVSGEMASYTGLRRSGSIEDQVRQLAGNLKDFINSTPWKVEKEARKTLRGQNRIANELKDAYGIPTEQAAAVIAVLSPRKQWSQNVALAESVIKIFKESADRTWDSKMDAVATLIESRARKAGTKIDFSPIKGLPFNEMKTPREKAMWIRLYDEAMNARSYSHLASDGQKLGVAVTKKGTNARYSWSSFANIEKAVKVLESKNMEELSEALGTGHKVRNFYNNIVNPWHKDNFITIDTHQVAGSHLRPMGGKAKEVLHNFGSDLTRSEFSGMKGSYGIYHEAAERAARELGLRGNELQSIIWNVVRNNFRNLSKVERSHILDIWSSVDSGLLTRQQATDSVLKIIMGN